MGKPTLNSPSPQSLRGLFTLRAGCGMRSISFLSTTVRIPHGVLFILFHDLRHYCASIQHAMGIPDAYIMQRGGWGSDAVLKNVYRHALSDKEDEMYHKANDYFSSMYDTKYDTK